MLAHRRRRCISPTQSTVESHMLVPGATPEPLTPVDADLRYADFEVDARARPAALRRRGSSGRIGRERSSDDPAAGWRAGLAGVRQRLLLDTPGEPGWSQPALAHLEPAEHALGRLRALGCPRSTTPGGLAMHGWLPAERRSRSFSRPGLRNRSCISRRTGRGGGTSTGGTVRRSMRSRRCRPNAALRSGCSGCRRMRSVATAALFCGLAATADGTSSPSTPRAG